MPFTLIFLGTDATYSSTDDHLAEALQKAGIKAQQTLSGVAGYIQPLPVQTEFVLFSPTLDCFSDVHVLNNQVVVIDGPDTLGQLVHDKIGKGLVVILDAIVRGETIINILGFSRGAVEALTLEHELQRIQEALQANQADLTAKDFWKIIANVKAPWCKNHLRDFHKSRILSLLQPAYIEALQKWFGVALQEALLSSFIIDPVPGLAEGSEYNPVAWVDPRHNLVPEIVARQDVIYVEDERSVAFVPVWVTRMSSRTVLRHYHIPGFHGTPDGNPSDHKVSIYKNGSKNELKEFNTRDVQTIVFYLILDFLQSRQVSLIEAPGENRFYLDELYRCFINSKPVERGELYFACYQRILKNIASYRELRNTHYGIGVEHKENERIIKAYNNEKKTLSECFDGIKIDDKPQAFINAHHFLLAFNRIRVPEALSTTLPDHLQLMLRIRHFLEQFVDHKPDTNLNLLVAHVEKDRYQIVMDVIQSAPQRLAQYYYSVHISDEDCIGLGQTIDELLTLTLNPEESELVAKKSKFLKLFQNYMQQAMMGEVRHLLSTVNKWKDEHWNTSVPTQQPHRLDSDVEHVDSLTFSDEAEQLFMQQAEEYYARLMRFGNHRHFAQIYPDLYRTVQQRLMLFPLLCEGLLTRLGWKGCELNTSELGQKIMSYHHAHMLDNAPKLVALRQEIQRLELTVSELQLAHAEKLKELEGQRQNAESDIASIQSTLKFSEEKVNILQQELVKTQATLSASSETKRQLEAEFKNTQRELHGVQAELAELKSKQAGLAERLNQDCQSCLSGVSWQILGGFITVIGVASVALAVACMATLGTSSALLIGSGIVVGGLLSSVGFYCVSKGAQIAHDFDIMNNNNFLNT